ncbi:MAG: phosphatidate cytidylyltransferase [Erysipelotrichaceae bacterium]
MKVRALTVLLILAIVIPPLLFGGAMLEFLKILIIILGGYELINLSKNKQPLWIVGLFIVLTLSYYYAPVKYAPALFALFFLCVFSMPVFQEQFTAEDGFIIVGYFFLVTLLADSFTRVYAINPLLVWFVIVTNFSTDTFAYLSGMKFGKRKLLERISPKKTIEGSIGGYLAGAIIGLVFAFTLLTELPSATLIVCALGIPAISQIGDLAFSAMKRYYGVKDFGTLLPGHGGVLDRIDSMIFSFIFVSILLSVL